MASISSFAYHTVGLEVSILNGQTMAIRDTTCYNHDVSDCLPIVKTEIEIIVPDGSTIIKEVIYPKTDCNAELLIGSNESVFPDGVYQIILRMYDERGLVNTVHTYMLHLFSLEMKLADLVVKDYVDDCICDVLYSKTVQLLGAFIYAIKIKFQCELYDQATKILDKANELLEIFDCECTSV